MKKYINYTIVLLITATTLFSCHNNKDEIENPQNPNDNELITTVKIKLTNTSNSQVNEFIYQDVDGDGKPSVFDTIRLLENTTYTAEILLLDETKTPVDTISKDVEEEGDEHQFFFTTSNANVTITYDDADDNGVPIGLETTWETGSKTTDKTGKVTVRLKHQGENKPKTGNGDAAVGSTDLELNFPIIIYTSAI